MPLPIAVPIILGVLGGGSLALWASEPDDEWADKNAFNARMKEIHLGVLQLNELLAKCREIHTEENAAPLLAWRNFVQAWTVFYADVGKKVYLSPSKGEIAEAKRKASTLNQWIASYKELCGGSLPTGSMNIVVTDPTPPHPITSPSKPASSPSFPYLKIALFGLGLFGALKLYNGIRKELGI